MFSLILEFAGPLRSDLEYSLPQCLGDWGVTAKFQALEVLENQKTSSHTSQGSLSQLLLETQNYNLTFKLEF